ncbi:ABC transporter permease [Agrobacterium tumefaciens]|nr:ABC transporter permease [Agrobacterium tumefaciens]
MSIAETSPARPSSSSMRASGILPYIVLRRLLQAIFVAWASFTLAFAILYWLPGDPVAIMIGPDAHLDATELAKLRAQYGFDRPLIVQYLDALWRAVHLDFGTSLVTGKDVTASIAAAAPVTAGLALVSLTLAIAFGTLFAVLSLDLPGFPRLGFIVSKFPAVFVAIPTFVVGLLLLQIFAFKLHWLPATGSKSWSTLVLPAITLAVPGSGILGQVLAKSLRRAYAESVVRTLRARGYSELRILRHALRQASLPAFTMAGLIVGGTIASSVVTETVFSRQGIGRLMQMGVTNKDINLVCGLIVFSALVYVVINLVVDLLYPVLDPRVKS